MYFTNAQMKALWFVIVVLAASLAFQYARVFFFEKPDYDFSRFDRQFLKQRDSILSAQNNDSLQSPNPLLGVKRNFSPNPIQTIQFPININVATVKELEALPRVGPKMAEKIIVYRYEHGPFHVKSDLKNIRGIGPKTFEHLKDLISVK